MLDYDMNARGETPLYEHLYRCIRDDIGRGAIAPDERLPSKRALAAHLGVSMATVEGAYGQLSAEGYIRSRPRSGYFANRIPAAPARGAVDGGGLSAAFSEGRADAAPAAGGSAATPAPAIDLTGAADIMAADAARMWARAMRAVLSSEPEAETFSAAPAKGTLRLRRAIAHHLRRTRGMEVDPECVVVGAGAQLLDVMIAQLFGGSLVVAVEDPGYTRLSRVYEAAGAQVRHVPLDAEGVSMGALRESGANVAHLMPSHQFPTGKVTGIARRYELLAWAAEREGRYIVEDDYDCEFRLAGRPIPPLSGMDACGRAVYTNTFSKSLGSALRLAYMVLPTALMERFERELGFYSSTVSSVDQAALARLIETGEYERHVNRVRKRCRDVRDAFLGELSRTPAAGRLSVEGADAGLHFVLAVRSDAGEEEIAARALERGVALSPLSRFARDAANREQPDGLRRFVVQYAGMSADAAPKVARAIAESVA